MKKNLLFLAVMAFFELTSQAQTGSLGINTDGSAAASSAILDVKSTNQGVLIPRMSLNDRGQIANPIEGLMIYQTDNTPGFYYYNGTSWTAMGGSSSSSGGSSIIPISSGNTYAMTTTLSGPGNVVLASFGSGYATSISGGTIDLTGSNGTNICHSFVVPKNGKITGIAGTFSNTVALSLVGTTISISAQVFKASAGTNTFTAVPGAITTFAPAYTGVLAIGSVTNGYASGLSIPVEAGDRLLVVYSAAATGLSLINTITGYYSGGITIE